MNNSGSKSIFLVVSRIILAQLKVFIFRIFIITRVKVLQCTTIHINLLKLEGNDSGKMIINNASKIG